MRWTLAVGALAVAASPSAGATTLHEPSTDFEVELKIAGAKVCFLKPKALRTDASACEGLDVAAAEQKIPPDMWLLAMVRFADWGFTLTGGEWPKRLPGPMSHEDGAELLQGAAAAAAPFWLDSNLPDFIRVNSLQVLRYILASPDGMTTTILTYVVVGKTSLGSLSFVTDAKHLGLVKAIAWRAMSTLSMPSEQRPIASLDGRTPFRAHLVGTALGRLLVSLVRVAVPCAVAVWLYRVLRRRRSARASHQAPKASGQPPLPPQKEP